MIFNTSHSQISQKNRFIVILVHKKNCCYDGNEFFQKNIVLNKQKT